MSQEISYESTPCYFCPTCHTPYQLKLFAVTPSILSRKSTADSPMSDSSSSSSVESVSTVPNGLSQDKVLEKAAYMLKKLRSDGFFSQNESELTRVVPEKNYHAAQIQSLSRPPILNPLPKSQPLTPRSQSDRPFFEDLTEDEVSDILAYEKSLELPSCSASDSDSEVSDSEEDDDTSSSSSSSSISLRSSLDFTDL